MRSTKKMTNFVISLPTSAKMNIFDSKCLKTIEFAKTWQMSKMYDPFYQWLLPKNCFLLRTWTMQKPTKPTCNANQMAVRTQQEPNPRMDLRADQNIDNI